jgi:hypothetical protein
LLHDADARPFADHVTPEQAPNEDKARERDAHALRDTVVGAIIRA